MPLCKSRLAQPTADYVFFRGKILSTPAWQLLKNRLKVHIL